ncbi:MAG TPA: cellulase family glycosylhydrolase, partial [Alphaproteobacteria bacterium]|nr:cellulase family glycosylhydrolase [Alphaproteobacteria bacterium]
QGNFAVVDAAIVAAAQHRLAVILDLHPHEDYMNDLEKNPTSEQNFIDLWVAIAQHYSEANYSSEVVAFELLNEPHYYHAESKYSDLINRTVLAIRKTSPTRLIVIGSPHGSSIEGLTSMQSIKDPRVIYDFHFYDPYIVTHQGIHRGFEGKMIRYFHDVPYPASAVDHEANFYAPDAPDPQRAQFELYDYVKNSWNAAQIEAAIKPAADWAHAHFTRVICGEFGVLRNHIDAASRYRWIGDTRTALEADGIGWALWDYADLMGITQVNGEASTPDPVDGSTHLVSGARVFEPEALTALGLTHTP